ncbi:GIY-YIG nuclease family protein [Patescibacteria group bacterium]
MNRGLLEFHYFYILRSLENNKLYLGFTADLKNRLKSHNSKINRASKSNAPFELVYYSAFKNNQAFLRCLLSTHLVWVIGT